MEHVSEKNNEIHPAKTSRRQISVEKAGFIYQQIHLQKGSVNKKWICPRQKIETSVERAVLSHFELDGWKGYWREGGLLLTLIKAMSYKNLEFQERTHYTEALYTIAAKPEYHCRYTVDELLEAIKLATAVQITNNFEYMNSRGPFVQTNGCVTSTSTRSLQDQYPGLELWMLLDFLNVAGHELIYRIARIFASNPYIYRSGWPDLTIWKEDQFRFIEVKAPGDSLGYSQKEIAKDFAAPLGLDFFLVDVVSII